MESGSDAGFDAGTDFDAGSHAQSQHEAPSSAPAHHDPGTQDSNIDPSAIPPPSSGMDYWLPWSWFGGGGDSVTRRHAARSFPPLRRPLSVSATRSPILIVGFTIAILYVLWLLAR